MSNELKRKLSGYLLSALLSTMPTFLLAQQPTSSAPQNTQGQPQAEPPVPGQPTLPPITPEQLPENPAPTQPQAAPIQPIAPAPQNPTEPSGTAAAQGVKPIGNPA